MSPLVNNLGFFQHRLPSFGECIYIISSLWWNVTVKVYLLFCCTFLRLNSEEHLLYSLLYFIFVNTLEWKEEEFDKFKILNQVNYMVLTNCDLFSGSWRQAIRSPVSSTVKDVTWQMHLVKTSSIPFESNIYLKRIGKLGCTLPLVCHKYKLTWFQSKGNTIAQNISDACKHVYNPYEMIEWSNGLW